MNQSFDTTVWLVQSSLLMLGFLLVVPIFKSLIGIALISASHFFPQKDAELKQRGVALLPIALKVAFGLAVVGAVNPAIPASAHTTIQEQVHIVQPGESLWSIAANQLAVQHVEDITPALIDREWRRLWRMNLHEIGGDPSHLAAGTRIHTGHDNRTE
jgi:hypothetical protein